MASAACSAAARPSESLSSNTLMIIFVGFVLRFVSPELLAKKFKKDITDERRDHGDSKIRSGKYISDCPSQTPRLSHPRALKFSHQEIGIKQENNKGYLDHRSPDIVLHGKCRLPTVLWRYRCSLLSWEY